MKIGNYAKNFGKTSNGDVSDYMFAVKGIMAVSPKLGTNNI